MKIRVKIMAILMLLTAFAFTACGGDGGGDDTSTVKPAAEEVKVMYDEVNDNVNYACFHPVLLEVALPTPPVDATYSRRDGTLSLHTIPTGNPGDPGFPYPLTYIYTLTNFVCGSYTVSGSTTAIITGTDYWTSTGTLTASGGDISTMLVDMARNGDPDVMTGTLTVNGYEYDYATAAYK
ncbi:MAG: hypothetical protein ACYDEQ_14910 [Desulfocucumaceae bacterium]